jgi:WD40 repeat protein
MDKTTILWETASGKNLQKFEGHKIGVSSVALSADVKLVATGSFDNTAIVWFAATGKRLRTLEGHTKPVLSLALSADGKQVLTGSEDKTAFLWDAFSGRKLRTFQGHTGAIVGVALSPDGKKAWTGSQDGTTRLWEAATGKELGALLSFVGNEWLVITPDGHFDGSAGAWEHVEFKVAGSTTIFADLDGNLKRKFHRPGLLSALVNGERLKP